MQKEYALITGGELRNKGAQAMSFITVCEVKRRFPQLSPVLVSGADSQPGVVKRALGWKPRADFDNLNFRICSPVNPYWYGRHLAERPKPAFNAKRSLKCLLLADESNGALDIYRNSAFCLDISGFAFGGKWGFRQCKDYLDRLQMLEELGVPVYLMPQSFGPFDFNAASEYDAVKQHAAEALPAVRLAFAREQDGFEAMTALCPDARVLRSADLVLQNQSFDLSDVFKNPPNPCQHLPESQTKNAGIVPNMRNYDFGRGADIDEMYRRLISLLLDMGYSVPLIRHASEDLEVCNRLKAMFPDDGRVEVYGEDRYCYEYGDLFSRCEFLVASRFHSIVHAYKEGVPCIATGWAVKYQELLGLVGQSELAFDVTSTDFDVQDILDAVARVANEHETLSLQIKEAVAKVQADNVFDCVERDFRELMGK